MRTYEISSPAAAELYFNHSFVGDMASFVNAVIGRFGSGSPKRPSRNRANRAGRESVRRQGLLDRLDRWFWRQQQKEQEAYLADARDVFDLERRIEAIDRGKVHPYY